ncbi:MAG: TetR/AcrR family transcriptional regulator [Actinomycetota bacterium]|nr:TetR/AcrR family transcriptional regulator [Actinomycetota bacterium]
MTDHLPRSPKGIARRQQILDRAIEVFAAKGADGTSLRAIAEAIGVSHGALLHYFHSREALLLEVLQENEQRNAHPSPDDEIVGRMVRAAERNVTIPGLVALYTSMLAGSIDAGNVASHGYFTERFERVRRDLVDHIRDGQRAGTLRRDVDPAAMAALVIAASDGLQTQWLLEPGVDIAESLRLLNLILEPRPSPQP